MCVSWLGLGCWCLQLNESFVWVLGCDSRRCGACAWDVRGKGGKRVENERSVCFCKERMDVGIPCGTTTAWVHVNDESFHTQ